MSFTEFGFLQSDIGKLHLRLPLSLEHPRQKHFQVQVVKDKPFNKLVITENIYQLQKSMQLLKLDEEQEEMEERKWKKDAREREKWVRKLI